MSPRKRTIAATAMAALGLTSLTPVQQGAALIAAGAAALRASPALAANTIPGVGTVIKKKPGDSPIIAPSDANGEVRIIGLEAGDYEIAPLRLTAAAPVRYTGGIVGPDGRLAFVVRENIKKASPNAASKGRRRPVDPVVERWAEPIAFIDAAAPPPPPEAAGGPWCPPGILCEWSKADLSTASAQQIADRTGTSMQSAVHIVTMREKGGRYASIEDFARRNCPTMAIDMSRGGMQVGDVTVLFAGTQAKGAAAGSQLPGFQCDPRGGNQFSLYGKKHNYVGHVTLLR